MKQYSVTSIIDYLSKKPNSSIPKISKDLNLSKNTVRSVLESLDNKNMIIYKLDNKTKYYFLSITSKNEDLTKYKTNTYFNLEISKEQKNLINYLFTTIKKNYLSSVKKLPPKTHMQKIIFDINKKYNLKLPIGWYQFGAICVTSFNYFDTYVFDINQIKKQLGSQFNNLNNYIKELVDKVHNLNNYQIKERQYKEENNKLYLYSLYFSKILENTDKTLEIEDFKELKDISKKIIKESLYLKAKSIDLNKYSNEFYSIIETIYLISKNNSNISKVELRDFTKDIFNKYWKILSLFNFKRTLKSFFNKNILDFRFDNNIIYAKHDFKEYRNKFYDQYSLEDIYRNNKEILDLLSKN
jgi:predicted transcriptional regulator